jgi:hypothetical protein
MITINNKDTSTSAFKQLRVNGDQSLLIGPSHSDVVEQKLLLKSVAPKRGNNQYGNRRSQVALVNGTSVADLNGDTVVRNRKISIESSVPVGTTVDDMLKDAYALSELLRDEAFVTNLFMLGLIEY